MVSVHPVIFHNIESEEYEDLLSCGCIRVADYEKDSVLFHTGDQTEEFGVLLSGEIHIENIDLWGNRIILHNICAGQSFAETYAFCKVPMTVDVIAVRSSRVLFMHLGMLLRPENQTKSWYSKLLYNLLILSTNKNLAWSSRIFCISSKSVRVRVMTYLSAEAVKRGQKEFTIPFDRQQMADYLNVDRSALSKELGRMQREGILTFHKNKFQLHTTNDLESYEESNLTI